MKAISATSTYNNIVAQQLQSLKYKLSYTKDNAEIHILLHKFNCIGSMCTCVCGVYREVQYKYSAQCNTLFSD